MAKMEAETPVDLKCADSARRAARHNKSSNGVGHWLLRICQPTVRQWPVPSCPRQCNEDGAGLNNQTE